MVEDDWSMTHELNDTHTGCGGVVVDCAKLNVREAPQLDAEVVCTINRETEVMIYEQESTDEFYKVCLASGIEGFCMKKFICLR